MDHHNESLIRQREASARERKRELARVEEYATLRQIRELEEANRILSEQNAHLLADLRRRIAKLERAK